MKLRVAVATVLGIMLWASIMFTLTGIGYPVTPYTFAWVGWLVTFPVIEGLAIYDKRTGDTLSEHMWDWASIKRKKRWWRARRMALILFAIWLAIHMATGGFI